MPAICIWNKNEDEVWDSGCGEAFQFEADGPKANGFKYCPYCGQPLSEE